MKRARNNNTDDEVNSKIGKEEVENYNQKAPHQEAIKQEEILLGSPESEKSTLPIPQLPFEPKVPKYRIVADTTSGEVESFDLVFEFNGGTPMLYADAEIHVALDVLVANHGALYLKINWFSDDMQLIIPSKNENINAETGIAD